MPPKLTEAGFSLLGRLIHYREKVSINLFAVNDFNVDGEHVSSAMVLRLVRDGYLTGTPERNPMFYVLTDQAMALRCETCTGTGIIGDRENDHITIRCTTCSGRFILAPGTTFTPPFSIKTKRERKRAAPSEQTLSSALDTLMRHPAPSFRRDPVPTKPGFYWAAFDDERSFDPHEWISRVDHFFKALGPGPYLVHVQKDAEYGDWSGQLFGGGHFHLEDGPNQKIVSVSFPISVCGQSSLAQDNLRLTWLGEAVSPGLPEAVEPY